MDINIRLFHASIFVAVKIDRVVDALFSIYNRQLNSKYFCTFNRVGEIAGIYSAIQSHCITFRSSAVTIEAHITRTRCNCVTHSRPNTRIRVYDYV